MKRKNITKKTFSKKWVEIILTMSVIDIQLVFILAFLNKIQIAETLGVALVSEVVGVFLVYAAKSFFETKAEHDEILEYTKLSMTEEETPKG